jgi:rod shape-determining protein MreC
MEHSPPPFFKTGPTPLVRLLLFSALAIALMVSDARLQYLDTLRQLVAVVVYPLQRLASAPVGLARRVGEFFVTHTSLREENAQLAGESFENAAALQQLKSLQAENAKLRELLGARSRVASNSRLAQILYMSRDPFSRKVIVDKGWQDEVKAGQAVIDDRGVVGQITRVYPWVSEVTLLTDKGLAVPVTNLRNGLRGVVFGVGRDGALELRFMPVNADIQSGDRLVTSGIDGTYPPGLPVAEITNIERDSAYMFARISGKPVAGVASNAHVLVLSWENTAPREPAPEGPAPAKRRLKAKKGL